MPEEILPNLYRIGIPLPKNPLKELNSYLIKAGDRNLIIDTGMNREECSNAMWAGLDELGVDLNKTDFFITHLHADHSGLLSSLVTENSKIYCSELDSRAINSGARWDDMRNFAWMNGFPENELQEAVDRHPGNKYRAKGQLDFTVLKENDTLGIGDYLFKCLETPGHTRGIMCLYDSAKKLLVAGDHILDDITPNISLFSDRDNPLDEYLNSLDKVYPLEIDLVLPGHRRLIRDCRGRIEQLRRHHQARLDEVREILKSEDLNAYQVAGGMTWDMTYASWDDFPASQKWFATGEAIAHLKYLESRGVVKKELIDQKYVFSLR